MRNLFLLLMYTAASLGLQAQVTDSSRLIGVNREYWDNNAWVEQDSATFTYSGGRGGANLALYEPNMFDNLTAFFYTNM